MPSRPLLALIAGIAILFRAGTSLAQPLPSSGANFSSITTNGVWTWYGEPKAVYYEGAHKRTYMSWLSNTGTVAVGSYDHTTGDTLTHVIRLKYDLDDHAHPAIIMRPDGRMVVALSAHDGAILSIYISTNSENITAFDPEIQIKADPGAGFCYTNLMWLSGEGPNGRLYCFIRGFETLPSYLYSDDWGKTWTRPRVFFHSTDSTPKPYCKYASNGKDEIHITIERGNRQASYPTYYMKYKAGVFYQANGKPISDTAHLPIWNSLIDTLHNPALAKSNGSVWDVAIDGFGRPIIVYDQFSGTGDNHTYMYFRWTGTSWFKKTLLNAGMNMGGQSGFASGITLDHENPSVVYLARQIGSVPELDKWVTKDSGITWDSMAITRGSAKKNCRPCVPRGHKEGGNCELIWLYGDYTSYDGGGWNMAVKMYPFRQAVASREPVKATPANGVALATSRQGIFLTVVNPRTASLRLYSTSGRLTADLTNRIRAMGPGRVFLPLSRELRARGVYIVTAQDGAKMESRTFVY